MLQQLPFPFMQRVQEQNHVGAVSEFRAAPWNMGHKHPGQVPGHDCAPSTPTLGSAVPTQDKPKPPRYPQIVRVCEKHGKSLVFSRGLEGNTRITDRVTVQMLSEFIPWER